MKKFVFVLAFFLTLVSCKDLKKEKSVAFTNFGGKISNENSISSEEMLAKFFNLNTGDTIEVKFSSTIKDLCTKKGCWMKLPLTNASETMVRFKDYGFFMPLDAKGKEVIVRGKAFVQETSVEELQHYAADAGKTKEEIVQILKPKKEFAFIADGVLLKNNLEN